MTSPTLLHLQTSVFYTENPLYRMDIADFPFLSMRRASSTWGTTPSTSLIPAAMQRRMAVYRTCSAEWREEKTQRGRAPPHCIRWIWPYEVQGFIHCIEGLGNGFVSVPHQFQFSEWKTFLLLGLVHSELSHIVTNHAPASAKHKKKFSLTASK